MIYMTIISILVAAACLARIVFMKYELKRIRDQLKQNNSKITRKKIDLSFYDQHIEALAVEINEQFDLLLQAEAEKRRSENELKQGVANISHDLRTPLTSILGYIQLLESDGVLEQEKQQYVRVTKDRAKRLQTLLNDFFELSIIESTDYQLKHENLKMNNLVLEILTSFYDAFTDANMTPNIHIPEDEIVIVADSSAVKRVIENLVINAIKHSNGNVSVTLKKLPSSVVLTIDNDAPHLTEADVDMLFDRFYTADQTRSGKGTGLGLAIAKSLVLKMNGNLSANFKDGRLFVICEWKLH